MLQRQVELDVMVSRAVEGNRGGRTGVKHVADGSTSCYFRGCNRWGVKTGSSSSSKEYYYCYYYYYYYYTYYLVQHKRKEEGGGGRVGRRKGAAGGEE